MQQTQNINEYLQGTWLGQPEGQLSVDVLETEQHVIVRSAIAGVRSEDLDITLYDDTLTIRGSRETQQIHDQHELIVQECHWGAFSRSIILPCHVDPDCVEAVLRRGILTITLKKVAADKKISVHDRA